MTPTDSTVTGQTPARDIELERVELGWLGKGHIPKALVVQHLLDEYRVTITEVDVRYAYQRFLPIRGEPTGDIDFEGAYFDEGRHGYWYDCKAGRGAAPYTWVDERDGHHA